MTNNTPLTATQMRCTLTLILSILLSACFYNSVSFEKEYYERISGIRFPKEYAVLETFDNGEWLTGTAFEIDSMILAKFVVDHHFDTLHKLNDIHLLSEGYLKRHKPNISQTSKIYFLKKSSTHHNWIYVADLNNDKLWAEISYPDWGGQ